MSLERFLLNVLKTTWQDVSGTFRDGTFPTYWDLKGTFRKPSVLLRIIFDNNLVYNLPKVLNKKKFNEFFSQNKKFSVMDFDDFEIPDLPVTISNDLERHVSEAFLLFDVTHTKTIDPKEIGTVLCALGCCPTLEEIEEFTKECEDDSMPNLIHLAKFLPVMCAKATEHCYRPSSLDELMKAFCVLDPENRGCIPKKEIIELMTNYGEPFSKDEMDEMLEASFDPRTQTVLYERYLNKIAFVPKIDIYALADEIEASKPQPEVKRRMLSMTIDDFL